MSTTHLGGVDIFFVRLHRITVSQFGIGTIQQSLSAFLMGIILSQYSVKGSSLTAKSFANCPGNGTSLTLGNVRGTFLNRLLLPFLCQLILPCLSLLPLSHSYADMSTRLPRYFSLFFGVDFKPTGVSSTTNGSKGLVTVRLGGRVMIGLAGPSIRMKTYKLERQVGFEPTTL